VSEDNGWQICEDFMSFAEICIFSTQHACLSFIKTGSSA
jgi:hypothetical protein